jgi:hypothetical protein
MYVAYVYEDRTLKPSEIILSMGDAMRENDDEDQPNQCTLQAYMEMSQ